jgi:hypothetical protein
MKRVCTGVVKATKKFCLPQRTTGLTLWATARVGMVFEQPKLKGKSSSGAKARY